MNRFDFNILPTSLDKNTYFKLDEGKVIKKKEINAEIDNDVNSFFNEEEQRFMEETINRNTANLKSDYLKEFLGKFFEESYLVQLKKGNTLDDADQRIETNKIFLETTDTPAKVKEMYTALNKIVRGIIKDRPNDFEDVLDRVKKKITDIKEEIEEEEDDITVEEELAEIIEEDEKKADKLTRYIKEVSTDMYDTAFSYLKDMFKAYQEEYIESNMEMYKARVERHMELYHKEFDKTIKRERTDNIVNLYEYILRRFYSRINCIDDGKNIILITELLTEGDKLFIKSGSVMPGYMNITLDQVKSIKRYGKTFTLVLGE